MKDRQSRALQGVQQSLRLMPTSGLFPRWATSLPHSLAAPHSRSHAPAASPTHLTFWAWRRAERGAVPPAPHSLNQAAAPPPYSPDHSTCHPTQGGHLLTLGQPRPFCRPENFPFLGFSGIPPPFQRPTANPSAVTPWAQPTSDPRTPMGIKNLGGAFPATDSGPCPRVSGSGGLEWGLRMCISPKFVGNAYAAGPETPL